MQKALGAYGGCAVTFEPLVHKISQPESILFSSLTADTSTLLLTQSLLLFVGAWKVLCNHLYLRPYLLTDNALCKAHGSHSLFLLVGRNNNHLCKLYELAISVFSVVNRKLGVSSLSAYGLMSLRSTESITINVTCACYDYHFRSTSTWL